MTRQDINYIMVHTLAFIALYAGAMAKLPKDSSWFDWGALSQGLIGTGVTSAAINIVGSSSTTDKLITSINESLKEPKE